MSSFGSASKMHRNRSVVRFGSDAISVRNDLLLAGLDVIKGVVETLAIGEMRARAHSVEAPLP